ncbi:MAG: hypothetical protein AAF242_04250 [Bacteroidota bacterium]
MSTIQLKTNINCGKCVASVKSILDDEPEIQSWEVDLEHPDRILSLETTLSAEEIDELLGLVGYNGAALEV